jgi:hypothetical protein
MVPAEPLFPGKEPVLIFANALPKIKAFLRPAQAGSTERTFGGHLKGSLRAGLATHWPTTGRMRGRPSDGVAPRERVTKAVPSPGAGAPSRAGGGADAAEGSEGVWQCGKGVPIDTR